MTMQQANERLKNDLQLVIRDAEELIKATAGQAGEKVNEIRSRLSAALESAKTNCQQLGEKAASATRATDVTIREHPYESLGIAFGAGILLGVLVARR